MQLGCLDSGVPSVLPQTPMLSSRTTPSSQRGACLLARKDCLTRDSDNVKVFVNNIYIYIIIYIKTIVGASKKFYFLFYDSSVQMCGCVED